MIKRKKLDLEELLKDHWFLIGILSSILLAVLNPYLGSREGPLKTEVTVKYGAVFIIFFLSGYTLHTESMYLVLRAYRLHFFIQFYTFVLVPFVVQLLTVVLWYFNLNVWILRGLITVSCMPPPVSSAVILTRSAGGNETAAIFNSVIGSLLGVFLTPLILLLSLGSTTVVPFTQSAIQLSATVLFPLFMGHAMRQVMQPSSSPVHKPSSSRSPSAVVGQVALLFIIYTTFCDAFHAHDMNLTALDVLITVFIVVLLQTVITGMSFLLARRQFSPTDAIAVVFCSTHKSLTLGIPILRIMYQGLSHASVTALPLLVYHPCQLLLGSLLTPPLAHWAKQNKRLPL